jgi:hypothetical protein
MAPTYPGPLLVVCVCVAVYGFHLMAAAYWERVRYAAYRDQYRRDLYKLAASVARHRIGKEVN